MKNSDTEYVAGTREPKGPSPLRPAGALKNPSHDTNPKTTNPKLGIAPWDMQQKSKSQDHKSQDPKCSLGYEQQIPRHPNPKIRIPRFKIKVGICKSQTSKPNPKANRTQFGFWFVHECQDGRSTIGLLMSCRAESHISACQVAGGVAVDP